MHVLFDNPYKICQTTKLKSSPKIRLLHNNTVCKGVLRLRKITTIVKQWHSRLWVSFHNSWLYVGPFNIVVHNLLSRPLYCRHGKIFWAKLLPNEGFVFMGIFLWCLTFITFKRFHYMKLVYKYTVYILINIHGNFCSILLKTTKVYPSESLQYVFTELGITVGYICNPFLLGQNYCISIFYQFSRSGIF